MKRELPIFLIFLSIFIGYHIYDGIQHNKRAAKLREERQREFVQEMMGIVEPEIRAKIAAEAMEKLQN